MLERSGDHTMSPADFFWKIFEATGSITTYLLYRQYISKDLKRVPIGTMRKVGLSPPTERAQRLRVLSDRWQKEVPSGVAG